MAQEEMIYVCRECGHAHSKDKLRSYCSECDSEGGYDVYVPLWRFAPVRAERDDWKRVYKILIDEGYLTKKAFTIGLKALLKERENENAGG